MNRIIEFCKMIERILHTYEDPIQQNQILKIFIFRSENIEIQQQTLQNQIKSPCGGYISDKELSFQCFTCGKEATHMLCQNCFEPEKHRNHQCIIDIKNSGICDCGVKSIISQEGFCSAHQISNNIDREKEINQISIYIQKNISDFIQAITTVYGSHMKWIKKDYSNVNITMLTIYHYANIFKGYYSINEIISTKNIETFYDKLRKGSYLHTILFQTIQSLLGYGFCYQLLITKILQTPYCNEKNKTIMEKLLEYQIYIEVYSKFNYFSIDKILYQLYTDEEFKTFMFSLILKDFQQFWLISKLKITSFDQEIENNLQKLRESSQTNQFITFQKCDKIIKPYLLELETTNQYSNFVFASQIIMTETQFISQKMQEQFFQQNKSVQDFIIFMEKLINSSNNVCSQNQLVLPSLFRWRYQYKTFKKIGLVQLKKVLDNNFDSFFNYDISVYAIKKFNFCQFAISNLIDCLGNGIEKINLDDIPNPQILLADTIHYILDQTKYFTAISVGLQATFANSKCTEIFKKNLIKLLFYQTYSILKKTFNLSSFDKNYINNKCDMEKLSIIKDAMIIQKLFTIFLSYLYCTNKFLRGKQFFLYLIDILDEKEQNLENFFNLMLIKTVQVYCTIICNQNKHLRKVYQGTTEKNTEFSQFERIDKCFIKLYIFLFDEIGFQGFQDSFQTIIKLPSQQLNIIKQKLFFDMIITENDLYNVCSPFLIQLPDDLKLSLVKVVSNHLNLQTSLEYKEISAKLEKQEILLNDNFPKHILQICEVDQTLKKLKLKAEYKILYEPILLLDQDYKGKIVERFIEQHKTESEIQFGNGIQWDFEQYQNIHYRVLQQTILRNYCDTSIVMHNIHNLSLETDNYQELCYLILIQIIAQKYFYKYEFEQFVGIFLTELEQVKNYQFQSNKKKKIQYLISTINDLNKKKIVEDSLQKKMKFQIQKDKFKAKFNKQSNYIQDMVDQNEQQQPIMNEEKSLCFTCKLELLPENKPKSLIFDETHQILESQIKFDIDLGLSTCRHYFHDNCLIECFENKNQDSDNSNDNELDCPVCKSPCLFTYYIFEIIDQKKIESFNQSLITHYSILKSDKYFENDIIRMQTLICIYINLFFDLLIQLLANPQDYKRDQKDIVFKQLLFCFYGTIQELDLSVMGILTTPLIPDQQKNIILNILRFLLEIQLKKKTLNQLRQQVIQHIQQYSQLSNEEIYLFACSFGVQSQEILKQQNNEQITQFIDDKYLRYYKNLVQNTQQQIQILLGKTFQEFHGKYFGNKCHLCKFYNRNKKSNKGVSVCLLCQQLLCNYSCTFNENGNLNKHAQSNHNGYSIFISLQDSSVYLMSSPLSIKYQQNLYFNDLGERIEIQNPKADWNTFILDVNKVNELASIIINCSYSKIIQNKEINNLWDDEERF